MEEDNVDYVDKKVEEEKTKDEERKAYETGVENGKNLRMWYGDIHRGRELMNISENKVVRVNHALRKKLLTKPAKVKHAVDKMESLSKAFQYLNFRKKCREDKIYDRKYPSTKNDES